MEFYQLIKTRESIRDYNPEKRVSEEVLNRILDAGRLAPSAANRQPWTFILVSSSEKLNEVRKCYLPAWFKQAPHILIVVGDRSQSWVRGSDGYNALETDAAIAMDHMILAAENEGVGSCWIAAYDYKKLANALSLNENEEIFCITPLGYPNEGFQKRKSKIRKSLDEIVKRI